MTSVLPFWVLDPSSQALTEWKEEGVGFEDGEGASAKMAIDDEPLVHFIRS